MLRLCSPKSETEFQKSREVKSRKYLLRGSFWETGEVPKEGYHGGGHFSKKLWKGKITKWIQNRSMDSTSKIMGISP